MTYNNELFVNFQNSDQRYNKQDKAVNRFLYYKII